MLCTLERSSRHHVETLPLKEEDPILFASKNTNNDDDDDDDSSDDAENNIVDVDDVPRKEDEDRVAFANLIVL